MLTNPISDTAFYCCGARVQDAAEPNPICNDQFAERFMSQHGRDVFSRFAKQRRSNRSNVVKHRIIDDLLRQTVARDRSTQIVFVGAGFDSRAFRLQGGQWIELDEPQIITFKNERLPIAECPNPLQRIPISFANESLPDKLPVHSAETPVVVVIEGVLIYLTQPTICTLLLELRKLFPQHTLICDLMNRPFFNRHGREIYEKLNDMGTVPNPVDEPEAVFEDAGYIPLEATSVIGQSIGLGPFSKLPIGLFHKLLPTLSAGYVVQTFKTP